MNPFSALYNLVAALLSWLLGLVSAPPPPPPEPPAWPWLVLFVVAALLLQWARHAAARRPTNAPLRVALLVPFDLLLVACACASRLAPGTVFDVTAQYRKLGDEHIGAYCFVIVSGLAALVAFAAAAMETADAPLSAEAAAAAAEAPKGAPAKPAPRPAETSADGAWKLVELPSAEAAATLIRTRRSVFPKDFNGKAVPREALERALGAANWAPTHGKTEPWRFCVFSGPLSLAHLHGLKVRATERSMEGQGAEKLKAALTKLERKRAEVAKCSCVIAVVCKRVKNSKGALMPEWEEVAACACAVQNLHLVLTAEGVAAYWSTGGCAEGGWANDPEVRHELGADGEVDGSRDKVIGWFHVGMSDKGGGYKARRGPYEEKVAWLEAEVQLGDGAV